jgi:S1-C subfamily serine protease
MRPVRLLLALLALVACSPVPEKLSPAGWNGVRLSGVIPGSVAAAKGLVSGDKILLVRATKVHTPGELRAAIRHELNLGRKSVIIVVEKPEERRFIALPSVAIAADIETLGGMLFANPK